MVSLKSKNTQFHPIFFTKITIQNTRLYVICLNIECLHSHAEGKCEKRKIHIFFLFFLGNQCVFFFLAKIKKNNDKRHFSLIHYKRAGTLFCSVLWPTCHLAQSSNWIGIKETFKSNIFLV